MDYQKIGLLIADLRKEKNLTQKELADKLGITDRAVSKWERGLGCPDVSLLDDLSRILDISILEILKGRRLDKDEIINNKTIIESMTYSRENFKYKLKKYFNSAAIFLIILISLVLVFYNIKSIYYLNKTYHNNSYDESNTKVFSNVVNNIAIIKNHQGIYSNDDYKKILSFIDDLEKALNPQKDLAYYKKMNYSYAELIDFCSFHQKNDFMNFLYNSSDSVYSIIHKYNPTVVENMISYYAHRYSAFRNDFSLFEQLTYPYYNNKEVNVEVVSMLNSIILNEYSQESLLLNDIIKVGEIK
jgi:transcriptional regulator with XRE-family HTH domain